MFPIFLFDRKFKQYNECGAVALSGTTNANAATADQLYNVKALSHTDLGTRRRTTRILNAQAHYDATFCDRNKYDGSKAPNASLWLRYIQIISPQSTTARLCQNKSRIRYWAPPPRRAPPSICTLI